ncbi:MAG TPA: right-handed parallel beta-helix repeat-containing protein [Microbacterium sp.]|uniref:right-handed parallel beta-helix repeat-containing protein n=1 Tax=Microbacterium sp. TaxID=51671 RepID=UPI002C739504|nr:right-handed parallel beta-helix repeat-containing protein [Microbacterium sp.]HWI31651.1 right-handed parallel beta-helix repeat-containing protein [Microbacterium sp.]
MTRSPLLPNAALTVLATLLLSAAAVTVPSPARAATTVGAGTYQETSAAIAYAGSWSTLRSSASSGGYIRYSSSATASATLTFTGPNITWYTWNSPTAGIVDVYVDGEYRTSVDNYSRSTTYGVLAFSAHDLSAGAHTISIRATGRANPASSGKVTHLDSFVVGENRSPDTTPTDAYRYDACPAATVTVATATQLTAALAAARPGSVISLAPGTYRGGFQLTASGTASAPIWVCGPRSAVVQATSTSSGTALRVTGTEHVRLAGFTVSGALQGVMVKQSRYVTVADLVVKDTGYEGIHLYGNTTDSGVLYNTVARTGSHDVAFGEGIYIGTSQRRWAEVTGGAADRSDRNTIIYNTIIDAGAEPIEAKEGTSAGRIEGNTITGRLSGSRAIGWILVTGNDWLVAGNTGTDAVTNGYASMYWDTWGYRNQFVRNTGAVDASGNGVWVHGADRGVLVGCDNRVTGAAGGLTNVFCTP